MLVDFFFGAGSRYSYLASTQLRKIADETGATFVWRPLFSGELIARAGGVFKSPQDPAYRTQDAARWARHYGVSYVEPQGHPDWRMVAQVCVAAAQMGAAEQFGAAVLELVYGQGVAAQLEHLLALAPRCGVNRDELSAGIDAPETTAAHEQNVVDALAAGAFGVPTFVTDRGVVVWGQDRLPLLKDCLLQGDA
jgi:2-hydroxychromene-2-carboxylate isomerase